MVTPFSSEDLDRIFDARTLTKGRTLILLSTVDVTLQDPSVAVMVEHLGLRHTAIITPSSLRNRVVFLNRCSCGQSACAHLAAGALAALDRFPVLRRPTQQTFLDTLTTPPGEERQHLVFELAPGEPPHACFVSTLLIGERTGRIEATTPSRILADRASRESTRIMAKLLGGGDAGRTPVAPGAVTSVLGLLARLGKARWHATGKALTLGEDRSFPGNVPPNLPPKSAVILCDAGPWYVDGATGAVGRVRLKQAPALQAPPVPVAQRPISQGLRLHGPAASRRLPLPPPSRSSCSARSPRCCAYAGSNAGSE